MRGLGFLPTSASIVKNSKCPPSKTGIGNKFIIPIAVDKTAINQMLEVSQKITATQHRLKIFSTCTSIYIIKT